MATLNEEQVRELRELRASGASRKELSIKFGVGYNTVQRLTDGTGRPGWDGPLFMSLRGVSLTWKRPRFSGERGRSLTKKDVLRIRSLRKTYRLPYRALAEAHGVSLQTIMRVVTGATYRI